MAPAKSLKQLTLEEYETLQRLNLLYDIYPAATGNYQTDTEVPKRIQVEVYAYADGDHLHGVGQDAGLKGEALHVFSHMEQYKLRLEVDTETGHVKVLEAE